MSTVIADLQALISVRGDTSGADALVKQLQEIGRLEQMLSKMDNSRLPSGQFANSGARDRREQYKALGTNLTSELSASINQTKTDLEKFVAAGLKTGSIDALIALLKTQIDQTHVSMRKLIDDFNSLERIKQASGGGVVEGPIQKAREAQKALRAELEAANRGYEAQLKLQQQNTSVPRVAPPPPTFKNTGGSLGLDNFTAASNAAKGTENSIKQLSDFAVNAFKKLEDAANAFASSMKKAEAASAAQASGATNAAKSANEQSNVLKNLAKSHDDVTKSVETEISALRRLWQALQAATSAKQAANALNTGLSAALNQIWQLAPMASGAIGNLLSRIGSLGVMTQSGLGLPLLIGGLGAATAGFGAFFNQAVRVERVLGPVRELHMSLAKTVGEDGTKNFAVITEAMAKYGLSIEYLSKPIARLKIATDGTLLGGEKFKNFLDDFAAVSSKFALPQEAIGGMAKAFEQMISKGTVQAEEFRQQLGDRLPAAARIGLQTFSEMTGNAGASFKDFMDAMKNRQIESTRFLDVFMIKLKETFGVTNQATDNLNSAYGRLAARRDLAINNIDQAIGLTRTWTSVLNTLAGGLDVVGKNAGVVGSAVTLAFGLGAVAAISRWSSAITAVGGVVGTLVGGMNVLRAAVLAVGAVAAFTFGSQITDSIKSSLGMATTTAARFKEVKIEPFEIKYEFSNATTGEKGFKTPSVLIAELSRYMANVRSGLSSGKVFTLGLDFNAEIDKAIAQLQKLTKETTALKTSSSEMTGKEVIDRIMRTGNDVQKIITYEESLRASLNKDLRNDLNDKILSIKDPYELAALAIQKLSTKASSQAIIDSKKQQDILEGLRGKLNKAAQDAERFKQQYNASFEGLGGDGSILNRMKGWFDSIKTTASSVLPFIQNMGVALAGIAAVNFLGLISGFGTLGVAVTAFQSKVSAARLGLLAVVAIGAAMTLASVSPAEAAEKSMQGLIDRAQEVRTSIRASGGSFEDFGKASAVIDDAKTRLGTLQDELVKLRQMKDQGPGFFESKGIAQDGFRKLRETFGIENTGDLDEKIGRIEGRINTLKGVITDITPTVERFKSENSELAKTFSDLNGASSANLTKTLPSIADALRETETKMNILREKGVEALHIYERMQQIKDNYSTAGDNTKPATSKELTELAKRSDALSKMRKDADALERKAESAGAIIERAGAVMEGAGMKDANLLKKITKDVHDYEDALRVTGVTTAQITRLSAEFRQALEMQNVGLNLATLQMKPFQAMQKSMESFSDSFANLAVSGQLNARTFSEAIKKMARDFIQELISMAMKAHVIKPILAAAFNLSNSSSPGPSSSDIAAIGNFDTTVTKYAKGGIVDSPTSFSMSGGSSGLMGEAGAEAIFPLRKAADGSLGVQAIGGNGGGSAPIFNITINNPTSDSVRELQSSLQSTILKTVADAKSRGYL